ncbi:MAG: virulence factor [Pannonibacter sp.]|jgi:virulence-associated protein VapD
MSWIGHNRWRNQSMFAIAFDLDTETLKQSYHNASWQNAYNDIARFLRSQGFDRQQGSVYFGSEEVNMVTCQTAVQSLTLEFDWFAPSVRDIRMLRIEDNNDLQPAIELALRAKRMAQR